MSCHKILRKRNAMFQHLQWPFPVYMRCLVFSSYGCSSGANKSIISLGWSQVWRSQCWLHPFLSWSVRDAQKGGKIVCLCFFFHFFGGVWSSRNFEGTFRTEAIKDVFDRSFYFFLKINQPKKTCQKDLLEFMTWSDVPFSETHSFLVAFFLFGTWISRFQPLASPLRMLSEGLIRGLVKG